MHPWSEFLKYYYTLALIMIAVSSAGQERIPVNVKDSLGAAAFSGICSNDIILHRLRKDPVFLEREAQMNREIRLAARTLNDTITLPVVFHIINQDPGSITDLQVLAGLQNLNDAFGKAGPYAASLGVDTKIRFCLAKKDPDGGNTPGITRTTSYFSDNLNMDIEDARLKNLIQWDPERYVNIWLISRIDSESYASFTCGTWYRLGVSGYATMPPGGHSLDGVVVTSFGALLAHEMGHYLGLYHTFEGGCSNGDCTSNGDQVCDTPPDNSVLPSPACNTPFNSCGTDTLSNYSNGNFPVDVPDRTANFMDYGNGACSNEFTQGQADRMHAAVVTQRMGLLEPECEAPCTENIVAGFTRDTAYTVLGGTVNFTNISTGAANYQWLVNDTIQATSTNFSRTFNAAGKYKISLKAYNDSVSCFASETAYVIVNCGVTARFYSDKKTIASKTGVYIDSIAFTNTSYNATTYQWLLSNDQGMSEQVVSTDSNFTYVFPEPANYSLRLIASNGDCTDTTASYQIPVLDPTADGVAAIFNPYCFQQTKIKFNMCVYNYGFASLPKNTPINFYDADPRLGNATKLAPTFYLPEVIPGGNCASCYYDLIVDIGYLHLDKLYAVFNDSGNTMPLSLPNTLFPEKNYANNVSVAGNIRFKVTPIPASATLLPGDTLQLNATATATPNAVARLIWSDAIKLSCTVCPSPYLYADSDRVKRVIATSEYGCTDTAYVTIKVPPADDYTIDIDAICAIKNKMDVGFTVSNSFIRGVIPKDLKISFYNGDPTTGDAELLLPVFSVPDTVFSKQAGFTARINIPGPGQLFAVVNDSSLAVPIRLPNTPKLEKNYTNNLQSILFQPNTVTIDTAICQGTEYGGHRVAGTYIDTLPGYNGCDSIRTLNLSIKPVYRTTVTAAICAGENYAGHTTSGEFTDVYPAANGCDSTRLLNLIVKPVYNTFIEATICAGENYAGHTGPGNYTDIYPAINGCDSTRELVLTVNPVQSTLLVAEICEGATYFVGGRHQTTTGTYYDTLKTYLGCDSLLITSLLVHPKPQPDLGADRGICLGGNVVLQPGVFATYVWQDGSTGSDFTTTSLGQYRVTVTNANGCTATDTVRLAEIYALPINFLPADTNLCKGNILKIAPPGYTDYMWSTGSNENSVNVSQNGTYYLRVIDQFGCSGEDSVKVSFDEDCIIVAIPNAFTPNNDGLNDVFKPYLPAPVNNYQFRIFNRLGEMVFESSQPGKGWDGAYKGTLLDPATFVYHLSFRDHNGDPIVRKGNVVLIR